MRTILVGLDGSAGSREAARWTGAVAARIGARVVGATVLHNRVLGRLSEEDRDHPFDDIVRDDWSLPLRDAGVDHRIIMRQGDPRDELSAIADEVLADCVVVGTRGGGGFPALSLGNVTLSLAHRVHLPLVAVEGESHLGEPGHIVVGIDGSPGSGEALRWAMATAAIVGAEVTAVFAYDPLADSYPHPDNPNWRYLGEEAAERQFAQIAGSAETSVSMKLVADHPVPALNKEATAEPAGLIVVGRRTVHSLHGHLLGRVTAQLLHHAACPVAVVPGWGGH